MTALRTVLREASARLAAAGIDTPRLDAQVLLCDALACSREAIVAHPERLLSDVEVAAFNTRLERRSRREPVSHITGIREFWSLPFHVTADVLDPRADSETLIEAVLDRVPDRSAPLRLLDLGTGSGCLLLTLLHEFRNARGRGIDASQAALGVARENAANLQLADRTEFVAGNWRDAVKEPFDIVVANPPYIPAAEIAGLAPEVRCYEPRAALDGGPDGLAAYRELAAIVPRLLRRDGFAAVEVGAGQAEEVTDIFTTGLSLAEARRDIGGVVRCLLFRCH